MVVVSFLKLRYLTGDKMILELIVAAVLAVGVLFPSAVVLSITLQQD